MDDLRKTVGKNLKKYRAKAHLTQEQVAEKAGISVPFYANIESGNRLMGIETLITLSTVLGVSTDCILLGEIGDAHIANLGALLRNKPEPFLARVEQVVRSIVDVFGEDGGSTSHVRH